MRLSTYICICKERAGILVFSRPSLRFKLRAIGVRFFFGICSPLVLLNGACDIEEVMLLEE
jgi:hypothetical protein